MRTEYLKELELLPMWQLRKPLAHIEVVTQSEAQENIQASPTLAPIESKTEPSPNVAMFASENGQLQLMCFSDGLNQDAQQLLQNIAKSMQLSSRSAMPLNDALQQPLSVFIVLGETLAQSMLGTQQELQTLREKVQDFEGKQVVVTEDLETMLRQPKIKAQVWQDCCLAMSLVADA